MGAMSALELLTGAETMSEIRNICKENEVLKDIKTTGSGRSKSAIINDINRTVLQMKEEATTPPSTSASPSEFEQLISAIPSIDYSEHKTNSIVLSTFLMGIALCFLYSWFTK